MSDNHHPFLETIRSYYDGCSRSDFETIRATFTDDVVHYFTHAPVIAGGDTLANFWVKVAARFEDHFTVDHGIVQGDECVIEWSLEYRPKPGAERELIRGAEWYVFREGLIAEIRAYYMNRHDAYPKTNFELWDYPYEERGYYRLGAAGRD
ncbi:MAG: nuclear transport factor 2 family protein [Pseudomonadota bacterium]